MMIFFFSAYPQDIYVLDSILLIADFYDKETAFHIFDKGTGIWKRSFGQKGQGPTDLLFPIATYLKDNNQKIAAYSFNLQKEVSFDLSDEKNNPITSKINNPEGLYIADIISASNNMYIRGIGLQVRFGSITEKGINILSNDYPLLLSKDKKEENNAIFNYMPSWSISPDGTKMVSATYIGGIVELFKIEEEHLVSGALLPFYKPQYKIVNGATPISVSWIEETIFGFQGVYSTDNNIYLLVNGGSAMDKSFFSKKIIVLDWSGNLIMQYNLDRGINSFTIDEDTKSIYAISFTEDENPLLLYYKY
jgi:hypothetical protein